MTLSTRIAVMNGGLVQQLGTPKEIYDRPANLFVATFMGSPSMNLVPVRIAERDGRIVAETTNAMGSPVQLPFAAPSAELKAYAGQTVTLGIRPEALTDPGGADRDAANIVELDSEVVVTEPAGSDTFVMTVLGGTECNARMRADVQVRPGDMTRFAINMDKAVVFDPKTEKRIP